MDKIVALTGHDIELIATAVRTHPGRSVILVGALKVIIHAASTPPSNFQDSYAAAINVDRPVTVEFVESE